MNKIIKKHSRRTLSMFVIFGLYIFAAQSYTNKSAGEAKDNNEIVQEWSVERFDSAFTEFEPDTINIRRMYGGYSYGVTALVLWGENNQGSIVYEEIYCDGGFGCTGDLVVYSTESTTDIDRLLLDDDLPIGALSDSEMQLRTSKISGFMKKHQALPYSGNAFVENFGEEMDISEDKIRIVNEFDPDGAEEFCEMLGEKLLSATLKDNNGEVLKLNVPEGCVRDGYYILGYLPVLDKAGNRHIVLIAGIPVLGYENELTILVSVIQYR